MKLVTFDAETYYDREYSLSKLTVEEYVRDPRFELIGFGIKVNNGPTEWVPHGDAAAYIRDFDWSDAMVLGQNTMFDGAILSWRYGVKPAAWADTLAMSRALYPHEKSHSLDAQLKRMGGGVKGDEVLHAMGKRFKDFTAEELRRYAAYCINDVDRTHGLFQQYMALGFPKGELKLIDLTLAMFIHPVLRLDKDHLTAHLEDVRERKEALLANVRDKMLADADPDYVHALYSEGMEGIKKLLMSNDKFAALLSSYGVTPPTKISPTTGKQAFAFAKTDEGLKALAEHPDDRVQALVAARLGNKSTLEETRTERFIGMATRGAFPVPLRYYGAHSGRWSGEQSVNLQNLPSRGPNAGRIKKAILAPEGYVVIDCDSSQIEARCLAWEAEQHDLVQAFENKEDVYSQMASKIYGRHVDRKRKETRPDGTVYNPDEFEGHVGKATILGSGYGMGPPKFKIHLRTSGIDLPADECERVIRIYRNSVPNVVRLWYRAQDALEALANGRTMAFGQNDMFRVIPDKGISLPNGLFVQYPGLHKRRSNDREEYFYMSKGLPVRIYGPKVIENLTQAVARCIVGEQMLRIARRLKVVLTVHDAVAAIARIEEAREAQVYVEDCMSWRPKWAPDLPLACESGMGASYGDC